MQTQHRSVETTTRVVRLNARRDVHSNVIHWREQAEATRALRQLPLPKREESNDTDAPLPAMLGWAAVAVVAWVLFGWGVVALVDAVAQS